MSNFKPLLAVVLLALPLGAELLSGDDAEKGDVSVQGLRCEYLSNPLGIDVPKPRLSWVLGTGGNARAQIAYRLLVASSPSLLQKDHGDLWDSGRVASAQHTWVAYAGRALTTGQQAWWKVQVWTADGKTFSWSDQASWSMGLLETSDWKGKYIGERRPEGTAEGTPLPFPWLRKTFTLTGKPARAVAYVNPLGYYELYINGRKVDDHVLSPAVTDYSKRTLYVTHEIADYLVPGKNVVALWLGRGWYVKGHPGVIHDGPLVRAQLDISMGSGSPIQIVTDESWKIRESPLSSLGRGTAFGDYGGERYDPALNLPDWNSVALDDSGWQAVVAFEPPQVLTAAQMVEPNRIMETIPAMRVDPYPQGGWVIDLGRNFTGWMEVRLPAVAKGTTVKLEYSDQAEPDQPAPGTPTQPHAGAGGGASGNAPGANAAAGRGAAAGPGTIPSAAAGAGRAGRGGNPTVFPNTFNQRDEIVGNGQAVTFRSHFNYHGFRYVRVIGTESAPAVSDAKGYLIRTAYERAGEFNSSNDLLNQTYRMVTRTYEALTLGGYVVDCPTRERLGYGGDAGTSFETGMFNFSTGGLYSRWLSNWRDAQEPTSGSLPHTAPNYQNQGGGGPMWGGMVVTLPWQMYLQYGDRRVLETNYPMMQKWLGYLASEAPDGVLLDHKSHAMSMQTWNFLGDWLTPNGNIRGNGPNPEPALAINTVHYLYQLQLAAKIAGVLGKDAEATAFTARAAAVARAVHQRFYNAAEYAYTNGDSVQQAFPLLTGMVPEELRKDVLNTLENTIRVRNGGHLDTGMHGTYFVMKYLMEAGRNDLIYETTSKQDYPGWGYMLANGATTSWEGWTGQSHIHDTLISIGAWFIEGLGGIQSDGKSPGFQHFVIKPAVVGDLTSVRAKYRSIHGEIVSDWRIEDGIFKLAVTVPAGTTASVFVPGKAAIEVAPGTHSFEAALR
jgi:hypothetical protein